MTPIRVVIADDHMLMAQGLKSLLEPEFHVVAVVDRGDALVAVTIDLQPEVIVVDVGMPGLNGIEAIRQVRSSGCLAKAVMLTMNTDVVYAKRAFEAGASAYVLKTAVAGELVAAIREVLAGNTYVTPKIATQLLVAMASPEGEWQSVVGRLSKRQLQILRLVVAGNSAKQMAAKLDLSSRTVETHKYRMMKMLQVKSTAELIRLAIDHGLVSKRNTPFDD